MVDLVITCTDGLADAVRLVCVHDTHGTRVLHEEWRGAEHKMQLPAVGGKVHVRVYRARNQGRDTWHERFGCWIDPKHTYCVQSTVYQATLDPKPPQARGGDTTITLPHNHPAGLARVQLVPADTVWPSKEQREFNRYATSLKVTDEMIPPYPIATRRMHDVPRLWHTFTGYMMPAQLFFVGIESLPVDATHAAMWMEWLVRRIGAPPVKTLRDKVLVFASAIRSLAVMLGDTLDDDDYDLWQLPFLAPDLTRAQMDCEDIKALHQRLFALARVAPQHKALTESIRDLCESVTSEYTEVGLQIGSVMGCDARGGALQGIHTQSWLIRNTVLARLTTAGKRDDVKEDDAPPVAVIEAMGNVCPLPGGNGCNGYKDTIEAESRRGGSWGHVYAVYVARGVYEGEYRPTHGYAPVDRWWTCSFTRVDQTTAQQRHAARAAFAPFASHLLHIECSESILGAPTPIVALQGL